MRSPKLPALISSLVEQQTEPFSLGTSNSLAQFLINFNLMFLNSIGYF